MSSYSYSRFLFGLYPRLVMGICALVVFIVLEEFGAGEKIIWFCPECKWSMNGLYIEDMDQHPYCMGEGKGRQHERRKMTARPRT